MRADDVAVAHTPPGGYGDRMPTPILPIRSRSRITSSIEQCGDRVITARLERVG